MLGRRSRQRTKLNDVDTTKTITHVGLCAGYGGIELGLKRVIPTMRSVALCEIEAFACANLVAKMEAGLMDAAPIWTDLKTFPWSEFRDRVDILTGGFPCQPFSSAGKRAGDEDPRHLFPYILEGIRVIRPSIVFLENVEGIISSKLSGDGWNDEAGTSVLHHVLRELERVGYKATAGIFSASECGASHQRKRVFILAHLCGSRLQRDIARIFTEGGWQKSSGSVASCGGSSGSRKLADSYSAGGWEDWKSSQSRPVSFEQSSCTEGRGDAGEIREGQAWPSRPKQPQHAWEPPRVVGNSESHTGNRLSVGKKSRQSQSGFDGKTICKNNSEFKIEPALGGNTNGSSDRMDDAELYATCDNRTDELRLLGNGVVPQTAEIAFRTLIGEL